VPLSRVKPGKSRQIAANEKGGTTYDGSGSEAADGWHFPGDEVRSLPAERGRAQGAREV